MDFTEEQLKTASERWGFTRAQNAVVGCEQLLLSSDVMLYSDTFTRIIREVYSKAIVTTKETLTLLYHGYPEGAMALSRILYESMIVMRFLYMHKTDEKLLLRYLDDYEVKISRDKIKYFTYLIEYSQDEEELKQATALKSQARKDYNNLKDKYEEFLTYTKQGSYLHDYWWVGDTLSGRSFSAIQNEVSLDNLKILYVLSCYRAHSGAVGSSVRFGGLTDDEQLATVGSLDGFEIPLCFSLVCFGILTEMMFDTINVRCDKYVNEIESIIAPYEDCLYR